jgi:hypothetical protein
MAAKEMIVYVRLKDPVNSKYIYKLMADTDQPMREIIERMVDFCKTSKSFKVPVKEPVMAAKMLEAVKQRKEKYRKLAGK